MKDREQVHFVKYRKRAARHRTLNLRKGWDIPGREICSYCLKSGEQAEERSVMSWTVTQKENYVGPFRSR